MAEGSERTPLLAKGSPNEMFLQRELDVQQHGSSTTESNKGDTGRVPAVRSEVDIEKAGSSRDSDDRRKLVGSAEEIELGETSQKNLQHPAKLKRCHSNPPRYAGALARVAAYSSRTAATFCKFIMDDTRRAINLRKERVDEARERAEEISEFDEATRYSALADKYDAAIKFATKTAEMIDVAAESAEYASMEAEIAANRMVGVPDETSTEAERLSTAYTAAITANMAAIVAYKMEYMAVKAMKRCWQDLDLVNVEPIENPTPTRSPREERRRRWNRLEQKQTCCFCASLFVFGVLILGTVLSNLKRADDPNLVIALITVGSILVAIPVLHSLYKIFMNYRNKRREARRRKNRNIIARIDKRLRELTKYFEINKISPVHSESDDEQQ